jgi:hypothetical protein
MSYQDDLNAKIEAQLDAAWKKCTYGKRFSPAYELAEQIIYLRILSTRARERNPFVRQWERKWKGRTAHVLLLAAMKSAKKLRQVADALDARDAEKRQDPRQANIIKAYTDCVEKSYPPTLPELRKVFAARFGEQCWPADFSVRKTLNWLGLPLAKAKLGRPRARSRKRRRRSTYSTKQYVVMKLATQDG